MVPSPQETYAAVVDGMTAAASSPDFGKRLLMGGKTKGNGRENWLSEWLARSFVTRGFPAKTEVSDGRNGRIDVAILRGDETIKCAIEVKFYFCHQCRLKDTGHLYLTNTYADFQKRLHLGVPQQAVVFAARYDAMPAEGDDCGLYQAKPIRKHLTSPRWADAGFDRFENDLHDLFSAACGIFPVRGHGASCPPAQEWRATHLGASAIVRAWVVELRPGISAGQLRRLEKAFLRPTCLPSLFQSGDSAIDSAP